MYGSNLRHGNTIVIQRVKSSRKRHDFLRLVDDKYKRLVPRFWGSYDTVFRIRYSSYVMRVMKSGKRATSNRMV